MNPFFFTKESPVRRKHGRFPRTIFQFLALALGVYTLVALAPRLFAGGFAQDPTQYWVKDGFMAPSGGQGDLQHCTLESDRLNAPNNVVGLNVYTPPGYNSSGQDFPVIYLLHGINGHEYNYFSWFASGNAFFTSSGSLPSLIEDNPLSQQAIVVMVNGGAQSYYNDFSDATGYGPNSSFPVLSESVLMQDVIPFVDANFRTIPNRSGRAIEGFSMGGRGAVKLAFKYPDQFCSTISYAGGGYETIPNLASNHPNAGEEQEEADKMSVITANNASAILSQGLQIRLVDGANDNTANGGGGNADLATQLTSLGIPYEGELALPGVTHNWGEYHQSVGQEGLNFHLQCFQAAQTAASITGATGGENFTYLPIIIRPTAPPVSGSCN